MRLAPLLCALVACESTEAPAPAPAPVSEPRATCSGVEVPDRGGFRGRYALTFDDGPDPETTPRLVEVLRRHQAPATFFVTGARLEGAGAALARALVADPLFDVGNHAHDHLDLTTLPAAEVAAQIDRAEGALRALGAGRRWFRFPYGRASCETVDAVRARGLRIVGWHVDSADGCYAAGGGACPERRRARIPRGLREDMERFVLAQLRRTGGGIVLLHDGLPFTADRLDGLLRTLHVEGFRPVALDDARAFPRLALSTASP